MYNPEKWRRRNSRTPSTRSRSRIYTWALNIAGSFLVAWKTWFISHLTSSMTRHDDSIGTIIPIEQYIYKCTHIKSATSWTSIEKFHRVFRAKCPYIYTCIECQLFARHTFIPWPRITRMLVASTNMEFVMETWQTSRIFEMRTFLKTHLTIVRVSALRINLT